MIRVLHVDPGSKQNGGVAVMISLLLRHADSECFSQSVWAPYSAGTYLDQCISDGYVHSSLVTAEPTSFLQFMVENRFDLVLVHSGAQSPLFIQPQLAALSSFDNLPVIEILHRPMPSLAGPFGVKRIVAVSDFVASLQPPELGNIVETIHNGIDIDPYQSHTLTKSACRDEFGIPDDCTVIGFLGRLQDEKGSIDILKAAPAISGSVEDACFVFGGDGPECAMMEKYADVHGINAIFTGAVSPDRKIAFLKSLDVILLTSRSEAFCLVALEAMAAGIPLVSYNIGPINELLGKMSDRYFLVDPGDIGALSEITIRLLDDNNERERLSRCFRDLSIQYSIHTTTEKYKRLIMNVIENKEGVPIIEASPMLFRYLGIMCVLKDDQVSARESFRAAIELNPDFQQLIKNDIASLNEYLRKYTAYVRSGN